MLLASRETTRVTLTLTRRDPALTGPGTAISLRADWLEEPRKGTIIQCHAWKERWPLSSVRLAERALTGACSLTKRAPRSPGPTSFMRARLRLPTYRGTAAGPFTLRIISEYEAEVELWPGLPLTPPVVYTIADMDRGVELCKAGGLVETFKEGGPLIQVRFTLEGRRRANDDTLSQG